ncbi:MAG: hypothetical protein HY234_00105 [Acidobacteria bacterium]|nr:hypothetical protein [Acidobacteriota bacterium]MBI3661443.1 hypothetical protein [Acidobacteriota bacterium]
MKNPQSEVIWKGRIHIGDEPGIHGDACYSGLCAEFPVTLRPMPGQSPPPPPQVVFHLEANDVEIFAGYPGHAVIVWGYEADPPAGPFKWKQVLLQQANLTGKSLKLPVPNIGAYRFLSIQVRADTTFAAGYYDDFVLRRLSLESTTHYASFGFQLEA